MRLNSEHHTRRTGRRARGLVYLALESQVVLADSSLEVVGAADVEGAVAAFEDVGPGHPMTLSCPGVAWFGRRAVVDEPAPGSSCGRQVDGRGGGVRAFAAVVSTSSTSGRPRPAFAALVSTSSTSGGVRSQRLACGGRQARPAFVGRPAAAVSTSWTSWPAHLLSPSSLRLSRQARPAVGRLPASRLRWAVQPRCGRWAGPSLRCGSVGQSQPSPRWALGGPSPVRVADVDLPVMPPVQPMLAKSVKGIPDPAKYDGLIFEPKWDEICSCCT